MNTEEYDQSCDAGYACDHDEIAVPGEQVCYWCKHSDHGESICAVPYTAINGKGITNSYPCGCPRSTVLDRAVKTEAGKETTLLGRYLLRRQVASLDYVGSSVYIAPIGCEQRAFFAGWDKAIKEVGLILQTPGGDGCFCTHHPDDPAHTKDCHDVIEFLLSQRAQHRFVSISEEAHLAGKSRYLCKICDRDYNDPIHG